MDGWDWISPMARARVRHSEFLLFPQGAVGNPLITSSNHLPYINYGCLVSALLVTDVEWPIKEEAAESEIGTVALRGVLYNPIII